MQTTPSPLEAAPSLTSINVGAPVRVAQPADEGDLMSMLRRMHQERPQPFPMSEDMVRETLLRTITPNRNAVDAGKSVCGIIGEPGRIQASIGLAIQSPWYSATQFLGGIWFQVLPEYRRHPHARELILFSKQIADAMQMRLRIDSALMQGTAAVAEDRLWRRHLGGEWVGSSYLYQPTGGL